MSECHTDLATSNTETRSKAGEAKACQLGYKTFLACASAEGPPTTASAYNAAKSSSGSSDVVWSRT